MAFRPLAILINTLIMKQWIHLYAYTMGSLVSSRMDYAKVFSENTAKKGSFLEVSNV